MNEQFQEFEGLWEDISYDFDDAIEKYDNCGRKTCRVSDVVADLNKLKDKVTGSGVYGWAEDVCSTATHKEVDEEVLELLPEASGMSLGDKLELLELLKKFKETH
jgi:hypothetical protein